MKIKKFSNGLKLVMEKRPYLDTISISVAIKCGSVVENKKNNGIAHFLEHMIFRGTKSKNYEDIMNTFHSFGGFVQGCTQKIYTIFSASIIKDFLDEALNLLFEMIFNPAFKESDIKKEKNVILEEINQQINDQPFILRQELFEKIINRGNKLSMSILGNKKSITNINKDELFNFHKSYYIPKNVVVAVVGNIKYCEVEERVKNFFAGIKNIDESPPNPKFMTKQLSSNFSKTVKKRGLKQSHILIGGRAPMFFEKDRYAMEVLTTILGNSMSSRIVVRLINKMGIAYSAGSYYDEKGGYYYNYASTTPKNVKKVSCAILEEIDKLVRKGVKKEELKFAKNYIKGLNEIQEESNKNRSMKYAIAELLTDANDVINFKKNIDSVKMIDMKRIIRKYLKRNHVILKLEPG